MYLPRPLVKALCAPSYTIGLNGRMPIAAQRRIAESGTALLRPPAGTSSQSVTLGGRPALRVTPPPTIGAPDAATDRDVVLYLHGGGYVLGSPHMYRALTGTLAKASGATVYALDYRLAPEHPYPAALVDAVAAVRELVEVRGVDPSRLVLVGDSAGGGLAVATARQLIDDGIRPAGLGLLSPWMDPGDVDPNLGDFVVSPGWAANSARLYRGDADPRDPGFAPLHADLTGMPPMLVHIGVDEALHEQVIRFVGLARAAGVEVTLVEHTVLWHSGHILAGLLREATTATEGVAEFVRSRIDKAAAA